MRIIFAGIGDLTQDIILKGIARMPEWGQELDISQPEYRLGGNLGNLARGASALGCDLRLYADIGDDDAGRFVLEQIEGLGLDTEGIATHRGDSTSRTYACVRKDGERFMLTHKGVLDKAGTLAERCDASEAGVVFLSGWCLPPAADAVELATLIREWRAGGKTVAADLLWSDSMWTHKSELLQVLTALDLLFLNRDELFALTGIDSPDRALAELSVMLRLEDGQCRRSAVVKLGKHGAVYLGSGGSCSADTIEVMPLDTVGAGDLFNMGYMFARYQNEYDPARSLAFGCIFASLCISRPADSMPRAEDVEKYLK